jgi:hypothetical protein
MEPKTDQSLTLTEAWTQMREYWLGIINEIEEEESMEAHSQTN